jgi:RNA polymerase sigma-70 factor, ECF subfamily
MSSIHADASDADLVVRLRQGNQTALKILYERYGALVYTLALKLLDRSDEAEDLTQDVFLNFWKQEKFDPTRSKLSTYLCLVTRSRAIDKLRSRQSEQKSLQRLQQNTVPEADLPTSFDAVTAADEQRLVRASLDDLGDPQKQILELSYYRDLSQSEISKQLNLPLGTVKTHMRQGLIKLRQSLQPQIGERR